MIKPLVSVIIAVYNGEKYLADAIESVLAQTYSPIELIIVDDGSTDNSAAIAQRYSTAIYRYQKSNQGQPAAINVGLQIAMGSYLTFLDADDLYLPDKIEHQIAFLIANPEIDMVFGYIKQFLSPDLNMLEQKKFTCSEKILPGYLAASCLLSKKCAEKIGAFNEAQKMGSFIEWFMRAKEKNLKYTLLQNEVLHRRIHANNMSHLSKNAAHDYLQLIKSTLRRRTLHES
ncbi:MAG: glycosyltransferase family 2 protein [Gammaproteobacteria bacterium CG_4_10_14_0_8_um_filter_38_16]|nr:MAG: glycosyltransferase family 2 protein [Gammaproteobacteria bacterium CG_4_10_14_0_8_um_filter_38_16]PJA03767.1 MAG: glycosyltransferase family 2 protein [Gammaproteobacteria bacterium CG_4_10_14_0_2_um_filter_38_22]PJB10576.1 MAG: glycosyltransferase family 2 protein [Gammaproteobacteria bacterium CG_4_9_14_3_um_filter_38_9]